MSKDTKTSKDTRPKKGGNLIQNGLYARMTAGMKKKPNKLYDFHDAMAEFDITKTAAKNALLYLFKHDRIFRHIDPGENGEMRYAYSIPESHRATHTKTYAPRKGSGKNQLGSTRIRKLFSSVMNDLAKLEDEIINELDSIEDREKAIEKVQQMFANL